MAPPHRSVSYVSAFRLRQLFNESQYPELIRQNLLEEEVERSRSLNQLQLQKKSLPPGTRSEIVIYSDPVNQDLYVKVHQYVLPDGTLVGSGKRDPKVIWLDGIKYCLKSPKRDSLHGT